MKIHKISFSKAKKINIYQVLSRNKILIVEKCFTEKSMEQAKKELINFFKLKKFNFTKSRNKKLFHRWDHNPKKARYKRIMCSTTFDLKDIRYFKNCINILKKGIFLKKNYMKNYFRINNENKTEFKFEPRGSLYPKGGGYYQFHSDFFSGEKILDVIPLSNINNDFQEGGLTVIKKKKRINLEPFLKPGSIVLMDSIIKHGILPIDNKEKLKKKLLTGRFSLISVMNHI